MLIGELLKPALIIGRRTVRDAELTKWRTLIKSVGVPMPNSNIVLFSEQQEN